MIESLLSFNSPPLWPMSSVAFASTAVTQTPSANNVGSSSLTYNVAEMAAKVSRSSASTSSSFLPPPHDFAAVRRQIELDEVLVEQKYDALSYVLRTKIEALAAELKRRGRHLSELQAALAVSDQRCDALQTLRAEEVRRREAAERQLLALRTTADALEKRVSQSTGDALEQAALLQRQSDTIDLRLRIAEEKEESLAQRERAQCVREEAFEASMLPMRQEAEAARKHAKSVEAIAQRTRDEAQLAAESISAREDSLESRERALRTMQGLVLGTLKEREEMLAELQRDFLATIEQRVSSLKRREDAYLKDRQSALLADSDASFWQAEAQSIELRLRASEKTCRELEAALIAERDARQADMQRWDTERKELWEVIRCEEDEVGGGSSDMTKDNVMGFSGDQQRLQLLARLRRVQTFIASSSPSAQLRRSIHPTGDGHSSVPTYFGTRAAPVPLSSHRDSEATPQHGETSSHRNPVFASFHSSSVSVASSSVSEVSALPDDSRQSLHPPRPISLMASSSAGEGRDFTTTTTTQQQHQRPNRRAISSPLKAAQQ